MLGVYVCLAKELSFTTLVAMTLEISNRYQLWYTYSIYVEEVLVYHYNLSPRYFTVPNNRVRTLCMSVGSRGPLTPRS